ncbi:hypothetical protein AB205_0161180 [Aquarana catesbeiana]|uniref:Uncharacterized protein n=1 Tax=Aquarana catesbeiana TaxID=8400 RepID=A0A2G9SDL4_AQUCT|nr:hypothetical protein AB205_0161180 [Aquarana catesbeiana]
MHQIVSPQSPKQFPDRQKCSTAANADSRLCFFPKPPIIFPDAYATNLDQEINTHLDHHG